MNFDEYESADFALQCKIKGFTTKIIFVKNFYFSLRKIEKYSFVEISVTDYYKIERLSEKTDYVFINLKERKSFYFYRKNCTKSYFFWVYDTIQLYV